MVKLEEVQNGSWVVRCPFTGKRNARLELIGGQNMLSLTSPYIRGSLDITDNAWVVINHVYGQPPFRQRLRNWYDEESRGVEHSPLKIDLAVLWKVFSDDVRTMQELPSDARYREQGVWEKRPNGISSTASIDRERVRFLLLHHRKLVQAARDRTTAPEMLYELSHDHDARVRAGTATNPSISSSDLMGHVHDPEALVRAGAARNPRLPGTILSDMASEKEAIVRASVAKNDSTHSETLRRLAHDEAASVRKAVANNRSTPTEILHDLSRDPASAVRKAVATNRSTLIDTLADLAHDPDPAVRAAVAANQSTPDEIREKLTEDQEPAVQNAAYPRPVALREGISEVKSVSKRRPPIGDVGIASAANKPPPDDLENEHPLRDSPITHKPTEQSAVPAAGASTRLPASLQFRRTIVTEIRLRGYPTACLRVTTVPRLRQTDAPIQVRRLVEALEWPVFPEEQTPETAARISFQNVTERLAELAHAVGITNDEKIQELVNACMSQPSLLIHENPHVPRPISWVLEQALAYVEAPQKPARAVLIIGRAVVTITIGLYAAPGIGSAIGSAAERAGDIASHGLERWLLDPTDENNQIDKIERYLEKELIDEELTATGDQISV